MTRYHSEWAAILPTEVGVAETVPSESQLELHPDEESAASAFGPHRRSHFAAGRRCARLAMSRFGGEPLPILVDDRRPLWPDGWVGSITHTTDYAAAAVARSGDTLGVGIDAERIRPMADGVAERIASARELESLSGADQAQLTLLFSAKEAFYKLQHPVTNTFMGFLDVRVQIGDGVLHLELLRDVGVLVAGRVFEGYYRRAADHVLTAFTLSK